ISISPGSEWTIDWANNHDSATSLRLNRARGDKRDSSEHQRCENEAAKSAQVFSFHFKTSLIPTTLDTKTRKFVTRECNRLLQFGCKNVAEKGEPGFQCLRL